MKRPNQRRTRLVALVGAVVISGLLITTSAGSATAASVTGAVSTGGMTLNVRSGPSAGSARLATLREGTRLTIACYVLGQRISGRERTTDVWDRLTGGGYVSDAYVRRTAIIPRCTPTAPAPTRATGTWVRPVPATLVSGFRTKHRPTHDGIDLAAARNTSIRSVAAGTVIRVVCNASTNNCNVDGSRNIQGCGWYAEVQHAGMIVTRYCHMVKRPRVNVGQRVKAGQVIGYVGSSGSSSGPHLHFEVHLNAAPVNRGNAVDPVAFMRARGVRLA
jgi:murein DD-endopeptidase MepM/ murein hydrolase activator NlpD